MEIVGKLKNRKSVLIVDSILAIADVDVNLYARNEKVDFNSQNDIISKGSYHWLEPSYATFEDSAYASFLNASLWLVLKLIENAYRLRPTILRFYLYLAHGR